MRSIKYDVYYDKVYGGWYGKCLGGAAGAPVEGIKKIIEVGDFSAIMNPELPNDDLDLQLLWLEVLEQKGPYTQSRDLADAWMEKCWYPFSEYGYFIKNYKRGIAPPYSGWFNNSFFKEGMGCPIRSEIWGFVFPGDPDKAAAYAKMDGELDHGDNSVWAEMFLAAIESMVFFENDIRRLILDGLKYIPAESKLYRCIRRVMQFHENLQGDWKEARQKVIQEFGHPDFTNSIQNLGFIVIALLYGGGDLRKTINIALACGYDADCTCATAASIVGGIVGYSNIDKELAGLIQDSFVIGIDVKRSSNSIADLAKDTCRVGAAIARLEGSSIEIKDGEPLENTWRKQECKAEIKINYLNMPSVGYLDRCEFEVEVRNHGESEIEGRILFQNVPENWVLQNETMNLVVGGGKSLVLPNSVFTASKISEMSDTNILTARLTDFKGEDINCIKFGITGATVWKAYGPFTEQLEKEPDPKHPSPHSEGCVLPTVECMVNNAVSLDKEYSRENWAYLNEIKYDAIVNAYEDMIPIEDVFTIEGQCCFYLTQELFSPEDREAWVVIGNSDAFRFWLNEEVVLERDESRYWTPYNNCELVKLKKGVNTLMLKLLRRSEKLKFSFGLRKYEGEHWHKKQWYTDFKCIK